MPVLGCGAEMAKLMDVSDQDVAIIEDTIAERLELGVSQAQAQRQAVDEALAQLAEERSMVMKAVDEQLGKAPVAEPTVAPVKESEQKVSVERAPAPKIQYSNKTIDDPQVGVSVALLELGKRGDYFRLPKSSATELSDIAADKDMTVTQTRDSGQENTEFLSGISVDEDPYQDAMGTAGRRAVSNMMAANRDTGQLKTWQARTAYGAEGTVMQDGDRVWINVAGTGEDRGGSAIYDLVANYAHNNGLKFIGDPDGLKAPAMRRRLENMLNAAIKYGSTDFMEPHARQVAGDKAIGVPPLKWTEGDTLANIRSMVDVSVAANRFTNPITTSILQYDSNNDTFADDSGAEFTGADLGATLEFDSRTEGIGQAGETTLLRNALLNTLLQGPGERRDFLAALRRQPGASGQGVPAPLRKLAYSNRAQTETPEFKKWFADSKVVDAKGKPLVVYHGSTRGGIRHATAQYSFFTSSKDVAQTYSEDDYSGAKGEDPVLQEVFLRMENPLVTDAEGNAWMRVPFEGKNYTTDDLARMAKKLGHDGVIIRNLEDNVNDEDLPPSDVYITLGGKAQIKSATGNNGQFDGTNPDIRFANKSQSKWVDDAGRWQFAPGAMLVDMFADKAGPLLDRIYLRSASTEVRHAIRKMKLDVQKAMETSSEMVGAMRQMPAEERNMISDIIERELKAGVTPSASAVQHAAMMNEAFETQTNELVRLGMLTQEAADRWRGKYLPRYYESKLSGTVSDAWADLIKFTRKGDTLKGIKGKHLRGRGMTQSIAASEIADYEAKGWEVRDKDFDPAVHDTVYVWRDFTKAEREAMGEIRDAGFRFTMGYMQTQKDIALGRMYEGISLNPDMAYRTKPDDTYVQVPDTKIPETQAKRYGKLAGMWVSRNLMTQLSLQEEMESDAMRLYRKALSVWKENKTVLNPVSHMNNFVSNLTMAHLAGVSYYDGHKYAGAIKDFASKAPMIKEAHDAGLFLGSMSEEELGKMLPLELQTLLNKQDSKALTGMRLAHTVLTWGLRRPAGIAYEFGDRFFKYVIYKDARKQGMEPQEAVDYAQKYIFTYDGLPKTARMIRDFAIPFFSYTYKAVPTLVETALTHPHRVVAPAALLAVASAAAYAIAAGGDDDDWMDSVKKYVTDAAFRKEADDLQESEYKLLPDWMKGRTSFGSQKTIRLGTDEATGNPVFMDTSRFIPGGDLFDVTGNAGGIPFIQPLTPSNPLLSMYAAMIGNKDMFTGKELVNKNLDTDMEAFSKRADWMWKMATPAIAINQAHWDRAVNAVAYATGGEELPIPDLVGGNLTGIGKDGMPVQARYAALNTIGIKAKPMDLDMSEQIQRSQQNKTLRDLDAQLRQARMQNAKGIRSDRNLEKTMEQIQLKKERLKEGLTVDGEARP